MRLREFTKGFVECNPTTGLLLGICATLATTGAVKSGFAMGVSTAAVLVCSNVIIAMIRSFIPKEVRIACYVVVIASFVTIVELIMKAYFPLEITETLGIFIPLIVVNCIILARAEVFAGKRSVSDSFLDGLGIGLGFTMSLTLIGIFREIVGNGSLLGYKLSTTYVPVSIMITAPGAFLLLGGILALANHFGIRKEV